MSKIRLDREPQVTLILKFFNQDIQGIAP